MKTFQAHKRIAPRAEKSSQDFLRQRLTNFGLTMIVMGVCFPLYYLGFFGSVDGPLNPSQLGERLAAVGVSKAYMLVFSLSLFIITASWNWIYNLISFFMGWRLTCKKTTDDGAPCGTPVKRKKFTHKRNGVLVVGYLCEKGHKRPDAHFHPVKKGIPSHSLWVVTLVFCIVVFCLS